MSAGDQGPRQRRQRQNPPVARDARHSVFEETRTRAGRQWRVDVIRHPEMAVRVALYRVVKMRRRQHPLDLGTSVQHDQVSPVYEQQGTVLDCVREHQIGGGQVRERTGSIQILPPLVNAFPPGVKRHPKLTPWRHRKLTPEETAYVYRSTTMNSCGACGRRLRRPNRGGKRASRCGTPFEAPARVFHAGGRIHTTPGVDGTLARVVWREGPRPCPPRCRPCGHRVRARARRGVGRVVLSMPASGSPDAGGSDTGIFRAPARRFSRSR